jgi:DNA-binding HxlR family transcriptional regulator
MRNQPPNERKVFECLQDGPLGFAQLVAATGVPNTSLSRTLKRLCAEGSIVRTVLVDRTPPRTLYEIAKS